MAFSNEIMIAPVKGKPHIAFIDGRWRVSPLNKTNRKNDLSYALWTAAHAYTTMMNGKRQLAKLIESANKRTEKLKAKNVKNHK